MYVYNHSSNQTGGHICYLTISTFVQLVASLSMLACLNVCLYISSRLFSHLSAVCLHNYLPICSSVRLFIYAILTANLSICSSILQPVRLHVYVRYSLSNCSSLQ